MNWYYYVAIFLASGLISYFLTGLVKNLAFRFKIIDIPNKTRKIHKKPIPLLGGWAIFISFALFVFLFKNYLLAGDLNFSHWLGVIIGGLILVGGGILDDKYNLSAKYQIIFPILAILAVLIGGVAIEKITNPAGGFIYLEEIKLIGISLSSIFVFLWLLGMMYTTKLLDGVDGLVSGVTAIGGIIIFLFTMTTQYYQPDIGLAALILAGSSLGFLILNWSPAKVFLGEGGSLLLGFFLGVLAIISGGKIAIALLVMGIPILDVIWTIIRRSFKGKNPFKFADKQHLHHRFLALGLSQKQTVLIFYLLATVFGLSALFLQSKGKAIALVFLVILMFLFVVSFHYIQKRTKPKLLLHICCAGCGVYVSQTLKKIYNITLYFYNPNLYSQEEYDKRAQEAKKIAKRNKLKIIVEEYNHKSWLDKVRGLENEPEKGKRCRICYYQRLEKTAQKANELRYDYFGTTLTVSPHKNAEVISHFGRELAEDNKVMFLDKDFKKQDGFKKACDLSNELNLYRQNFCGCEFSFRKKT